MNGLFYLPRGSLCEETIIAPNSITNNTNWTPYTIPSWARMISILCIAGGGGGGNGVVGANSTAAGGGGGGSGGQTQVIMQTRWLPRTIWATVGHPVAANTAGVACRVAVVPDSTTNHVIAAAAPGGAGGNASGATAGAAGSAGTVQTIANFPRAGVGAYTTWAGQAGIIGGTTVAGANLTLPTTGLIVTGGMGGGGLPATATNGTNGGGINTVSSNIFYPAHTGGVGGANATTPGGNGNSMPVVIPPFQFFFGGTGGGSSHGSATTTGLVGGLGGDGSYGCGGGGGGGALTGSTQGTGGKGGPALCLITVW